LGAYCHIDSKEISYYMDTVKYDESFTASGYYTNGKYFLLINNKMQEIDGAEYIETSWQEYPYFGGESKAPKDMVILIKNN
jgi:hypothetical protein